MSTLSAPLVAGDTLPRLALVSAAGAPVALETLAASSPRTVLYFMRTSTCPVCHQHLRAIGRMGLPAVVIVPGGAAEAAAVARRHPALAATVVASEDAHAAVGLFVRHGLQQSGTYVVEGARIIAARHATVPLGSFDAAEVTAALA
ncbi:hypothetical protein [Demequina gelatinilytica]|uniref:hypothetical protein n=1 Tax=Demequina gelatinilytica TaxID=1638980 RepID=UPI000783455A|nr:hypothetical protein [Demequina gelatinilytica]